MKKLIPAIAIAAVGIVSLAASPARADERGYRGEDRGRAPYSAPARPDDRGYRGEDRDHDPYWGARAMPVRREAPVRYYRHERWEMERARERRMLEERREAFYAHRHNRWERARFERWYSERCHDLDRGLRIGINFGF